MTTPITLLTKVRVEGFRSIKEATVDLAPINVLIGPNGSGKSNLLSVLRLVQLIRSQSLRGYVGKQGGADRFLHYGHKKTSKVLIALEFKRDDDRFEYRVTLEFKAGNQFSFAEESVSRTSPSGDTATEPLGTGHEESLLPERAKDPANVVARSVNALIEGMSFFHFHDTSLMSPLRADSHTAENVALRPDGSNLAAMLRLFKQSENSDIQPGWKRIEGLAKSIAPFIKSLDPDLVEPTSPKSAVRLFWTHVNGHRFDTWDLSDGTLRALALATALAQPAAMLPNIIVIDEPELGLHPAALSLIASVMRSVAHYSQIIVATQSAALLDEFRPEDVIVVEQESAESTFRRLDPLELEGWLDEYSLSELYDKNVLGGRP